MDINNKLKYLVKSRGKLFYIIARYIVNKDDVVKLIKGNFEEVDDYVSILIAHNGMKFPNRVFYYISSTYGRTDEIKTVRSDCGFCAALRITLEMLYFSDFLGFTPVVDWGNTSTYYDSCMDYITTNVFEYYFYPVSEVDYREVKDLRNVVKGEISHGYFLMKHPDNYAITQDEIEIMASVFKKYIHLNEKTKKYIENNVNDILKNGAVLGCHVRGTDYCRGHKDHPIMITTEEYLAKVKELYSSGGYEKVFLATDDGNALEMFQREFGDRLLYYIDVFRTKNQCAPHTTCDSRPMHYYKLGLEILRDVYTLANCDSLVCGLSQVSFAARYVNIALERRYNEIVLLNNGLVKEDSAKARKYLRQRKSRER